MRPESTTPSSDFPHGFSRGYRRGCRCDACCEAQREVWRRASRTYHHAHRAEILSRERKYYPQQYDPVKRKAHSAVQVAVNSGRLLREPCEVCGCETAQAHHDDYSHPLSVRWLCCDCHCLVHRKDAP